MQKVALRRGFTLIELLVVVLILGILVSVALPNYLSTAREGRHRVANTNARAIAAVIHSNFVQQGGRTYATITEALIEADFGDIPVNPCTGGNSLTADYAVTLEALEASVTAQPGTGVCDPSELRTFHLYVMNP